MPINSPPSAYARPHYDMPQRSTSPTPSELEEADTTPFGFMSLFHTRGKEKSPWATIGLIALGIIFIVIFALTDKIVKAINPVAQDLRDMKGGWAIPIGILIVLSFPPLFGHEIIAMMTGVVWGMWKGFLIVAIGTLVGEIANWFVFKTFCSGRAKEYERNQLAYACLARVVREGGFWVVLVIRYSAIPPHFTTVVFSVCGINFFVYLGAAILSLPKQALTVYLGVSAAKTDQTKASKWLSTAVIAFGILVTIVSAHWTFRKMDGVRPSVVEERRARRGDNYKLQGTSIPVGSQRNDARGGGVMYEPLIDADMDAERRPPHSQPPLPENGYNRPPTSYPPSSIPRS